MGATLRAYHSASAQAPDAVDKPWHQKGQPQDHLNGKVPACLHRRFAEVPAGWAKLSRRLRQAKKSGKRTPDRINDQADNNQAKNG